MSGQRIPVRDALAVVLQEPILPMRTIIDVSMRTFRRETVSNRLRYRFTAAPYPDRPKPGDAKKADGVSARACEGKQPFLIERTSHAVSRPFTRRQKDSRCEHE